MRFMTAAGWALIAVSAALLAGDAESAAVLPRKKLVLLPKAKPAVSHVAVAKPPAPTALARVQARPVARFAFRAVQPRLPLAVGKPAKLAPAPAAAAARYTFDKPVLLAISGDWSAFRAAKADASTCFAATAPKDTSPRVQDRAAPYLYLTEEPAGSINHELTIRLGFASEISGVTANVDGRDFALTASGGLAYPADKKSQAELMLAMRRGHTLLVRTTLKGYGAQSITDAFSMLGVDDALKTTDAACTTLTERR